MKKVSTVKHLNTKYLM